MRASVWVLGFAFAVACSTSHHSASDPSAGASTSKEALAERGITALRAADVSAYRALFPPPEVLPSSCDWSAEYAKVLSKILGSVDQPIAECSRLIDWAKARVTPRGYHDQPSPERGCQQVIGYGDATFDVSVNDKRYQVTVEDVMEIHGRFYTFDHPQCREVSAR